MLCKENDNFVVEYIKKNGGLVSFTVNKPPFFTFFYCCKPDALRLLVDVTDERLDFKVSILRRMYHSFYVSFVARDHQFCERYKKPFQTVFVAGFPPEKYQDFQESHCRHAAEQSRYSTHQIVHHVFPGNQVYYSEGPRQQHVMEKIEGQ